MYSCSSQPYRLSRDAETEELQVSCCGQSLPHKPLSRVSALLPLTNPQVPLKTSTRRRPPLSGQRLPLYSLTAFGDIQHQKRKLLQSPLPKSFNSNFQHFVAQSEAMSDLTEDYGRECETSGSCVHLINDLIIFTGNDGKLRVARLKDSDSPLFSRLPGPAVTISDPALSSSSRILSLHPRACSDGSVTVLARYRQGAAIFSIQETEGERERPGWVRSVPPSLPVSDGLASVCWTLEHLGPSPDRSSRCPLRVSWQSGTRPGEVALLNTLCQAGSSSIAGRGLGPATTRPLWW